LSQYYLSESAHGEHEKDVLRQIRVDVPRTSPGVTFFHHSKIQESLERILYIWAIRHPASGYVQGINDLSTPFYCVFLRSATGKTVDEADADKITSDELTIIEADTFWCLSKVLDEIQDHYTFAQPGIQRMVFKLNELVERIDAPVHSHLKSQSVLFIQFAFRWMNCYLMREISLPLIIRVWDTYLSEENGDGFKAFHVYVCAAFLLTWSKKLLSLEFQDLVIFLQRLPTEDWTDKEIEPILSQAFVYKSLYHNSPQHLR